MDPRSSEGSEQHDATAAGLDATQTALSDPLGEETRKSRLYLLGLSMVSIAIVHTGLVPQEISTLGIQFGEANRKSLLIILALLVLYYLAAFLLYGMTEFVAWRTAYTRAIWDLKRPTQDADSSAPEMDPTESSGYFFAKGISTSRAVFEFLLPTLVGSYAMGVLVFAVATW